jgi:hypothetical protein
LELNGHGQQERQRDERGEIAVKVPGRVKAISKNQRAVDGSSKQV